MKILLLLLTISLFVSSQSNENISCYYYGQKEYLNPVKEKECLSMAPSDKYMINNENSIFISKKVTQNARYDEYNLSYIISDIGPFYFIKNGKTRRALGFDSGADYFKDGLARTINTDKKIGYFDTKLNIVIKPKYDFAYPFENKKAIVCNGCTKKRVGEHYTSVGGVWGIIDTNGTIIEPLVHTSFQETYKIIIDMNKNESK